MKRILICCAFLIWLPIVAFAESPWSTVDAWIEHANEIRTFNNMIGLIGEDSSYEVIDGILFKNKVLFKYPAQKATRVCRIPEGTTGIDPDAFRYDNSSDKPCFDYLYIPASCVELGFDSELDNKEPDLLLGLALNYVVDENHPYLCSQDGVLYSKDKKILCLYPIKRSEIYFAVPEGVERIGKYAFYYGNISYISFPSSLQRIGESSFCANNFVTLQFPEGLLYIERYAFEGCIFLTSIELLSTLDEIGYSAFQACSLTEIWLPDGLRILDSYAFYGNPIREVILPLSLEYIGDTVFESGTSSGNVYNPVYYVYESSYGYEWTNNNNVSYHIIKDNIPANIS